MNRHPLPCVHLGEHLPDTFRRGIGDATMIYVCPVHGQCSPVGRPGVARCYGCYDYIPRDPHGPSAQTMHARSLVALAAAGEYPQDRYHGRGIVIAAGGDRYLASLWVTVHAIRHVGCNLPIEVWYLGAKREMPPRRQRLFHGLGCTFRDGDAHRLAAGGGPLTGWPLKIYGTLHSDFEEVMFFDADSYPVVDPTFLFDCPEYRELGAMFWPESYPGADRTLRWPAFGVEDPGNPVSIETGQYIVDKRDSWRPLNMAWWYADHYEYYFRYGYGDKGAYEVAWPATGQRYARPTDLGRWDRIAYLHTDSAGSVIIVHRCRDKFRATTGITYPMTTQHCEENIYSAWLPLEAECWRWLEELRAKL